MVLWIITELGDVGSTQKEAAELAARGAPEGTTVVARSQASGEGRLGRTWVSPAGGLYMSFVLRPRNLTRLELATLVSAVAVVQGIKDAAGLRTTIRWPNDVMVGGKKLAGVIARAESHGNTLSEVVIGIGVNCNTPLAQIEVQNEKVTTIAEELGRNQNTLVLRDSILESFSKLYEEWKTGAEMSKTWRGHLDTLGKQVSIKLKTNETPFSYIARGIDRAGGLVVAEGRTTKVINAEELEWLREGS